MTPLPFIEEHRFGPDRQRQRDGLPFTRIEVSEGGIDLRRWSDFEPIRGFGEKAFDAIRRRVGSQLAMYSFGNENSIEQLGRRSWSSVRIR